MRWHVFSSFKYYASAAIALVGISAASTLLTDRPSLAQQPQVATTVKAEVQDDELSKLELTERILADTLGKDHPKLREVRTRIEHAHAMAQQAAAEKAMSDANRVLPRLSVETLRSSPGMGKVSPDVLAKIKADDEVVTEEVLGNQTVVVRRFPDGNVHTDLLGSGPREVRNLFIASDPQQHKAMQQALDKLNDKDASDKDKSEAKEKLSSILGKQFDQDMEQRSKQIADLEKKVATLKEQIEKRKDAKSRLIELRIELLLNESEGLGFPSSWQQSSVPNLRAVTIPKLSVPPAPPAPPLPPAAPIAK